MRQRPGAARPTEESLVKDIRRHTRTHQSADKKIPIVLDWLRGGDNEPCRAIGLSDNGDCRTLPT